MKELTVKIVITERKHKSVDSEGKENKAISEIEKLKDEENNMDLYHMEVESDGKFSRKANWEDLSRYSGKDINSDVLRDWILQYQKRCFPEDLLEPNHAPKTCYIKDENGVCLYKDYGWKPIKLNLKPDKIDVQEQWTKKVLLESFDLDFATNTDKILSHDKCDKTITSSLRKSKVCGHPLALEMIKADSKIVAELKGINSVTFGVFGNGGPSETDGETGCEVWKDVKTLRALLQNVEFPSRKGNSREASVGVVANECFLKARIYYKSYFSNDVVSDHVEKFRGMPYWKFPIKYLFRYNDVPDSVQLYEDIELTYFTDIKTSMDSKDWEWIKGENGRWKKQHNT
mmetsp:Transcript_1143/g.2575  ORF Transcript_1143/g.2575 Transcript_1143/m.2575 type:complete len:344 (+) Transcript_1143:98-1129(+)|eukprot:CAMPEP_0201273002 /NCGR_PEP_ID=MMETSP0853-20130426/43488_1 /ASSEMBLY_ACC=CAM_ASM_000640 /TAXON_ID=183588 /ORGANISM="Pseudo-nitzschia fraudulenta, Strain WWA7" /LENGTH=343 /DNA_ID=CAMNT_0047580015 /DNA_START=12 /DNA_END=1043 /DNA_ORIENTATION=+